MQPNCQWIYVVREEESLDAPVIFEGGRLDVMEFLNVTDNKLYYYCQKEKPLKREGRIYWISRRLRDDKDFDDYESRRAKTKEEKFEEEIDTIERHLKIYGNTIIYKNPKKHLARLQRDGYLVKASHEPKRTIHYVHKPGENKRHEVYKECWILTLVERREPII